MDQKKWLGESRLQGMLSKIYANVGEQKSVFIIFLGVFMANYCRP